MAWRSDADSADRLAVDLSTFPGYCCTMSIWLQAILTTIGMVVSAVCLAAVVAAVARLISYYGPDQVLQVVSVPMAIVGLLSLTSWYLAPRVSRRPYGKRR